MKQAAQSFHINLDVRLRLEKRLGVSKVIEANLTYCFQGKCFPFTSCDKMKNLAGAIGKQKLQRECFIKLEKGLRLKRDAATRKGNVETLQWQEQIFLAKYS